MHQEISNGEWRMAPGSALRHAPSALRHSPAPLFNAGELLQRWFSETLPEARAAFAQSLGLSVLSLSAVGAVWAKPYAAWAFPMSDGRGRVVGIRLRNESGKFAVKGSKQGIFETNAPVQTILYVCEGPTDTAAANQLGLFAVGRANCCCGGLEVREYARRAGVTHIVLVADNDKPGLDGARKVACLLNLPFVIYVPPSKDLRKFVCLGGTREMVENAVHNTEWKTSWKTK